MNSSMPLSSHRQARPARLASATYQCTRSRSRDRRKPSARSLRRRGRAAGVPRTRRESERAPGDGRRRRRHLLCLHDPDGNSRAPPEIKAGPHRRLAGGTGLTYPSLTVEADSGRTISRWRGVLTLYASPHGGPPALEVRVKAMCRTPPHDRQHYSGQLTGGLHALGIPRLDRERDLSGLRPEIPAQRADRRPSRPPPATHRPLDRRRSRTRHRTRNNHRGITLRARGPADMFGRHRRPRRQLGHTELRQICAHVLRELAAVTETGTDRDVT